MSAFVEFTGPAKLGRQTKRLTRRLRPGDIAIIDHRDIDRVSAEELLDSGARVVGDGIHIADDHVRLEAVLEERVSASVDRDEQRFEVADERPDDPQVALVPGTASDDERMAVAEARAQDGEIDPLREEPPFLAKVSHRVLGELLERLGDAAALLGKRAREVVRAEHAA